MFVSHYKATRHYGGPEEGGWWYDRYEFVKAETNDIPKELAFNIARAYNTNAKLEKRQPNGATYQGRFSTANHTDDLYFTEDVLRSRDNTNEPRPTYA